MKNIYGTPCCPYCSTAQSNLGLVGDQKDREFETFCADCDRPLTLIRKTNEELKYPKEEG